MTSSRLLFACLALATAIPATPAAPAPMYPGKGHVTPQACFQAAVTAARKKDFKAWSACLCDDARAIYSGHCLAMAAFEITANKGAYKAINPAQVLMRPRASGGREAGRTDGRASTLSGMT